MVPAPMGVILKEDACGGVKGEAQTLRAVAVEKGERRGLAVEKTRSRAVEGDGDSLPVNLGTAAGNNRSGDVARDKGFKNVGV